MNKEAIAAKKLLKALAFGGGGAALAGGGAVAGHFTGYRTGAKRTADQMAVAFSDANARENRAIVNAFNLANKKENAILADRYMKAGYQMGIMNRTAKGMGKTAQLEESYGEAFVDELSKLGFDISEIEKMGSAAIAGMARSAMSALGKSFKSLPGLGKSIARTGKTGYTAGKRVMSGGNVTKTMSGKLGQNLRGLKKNLKAATPALATVGAGTAATYAATR